MIKKITLGLALATSISIPAFAQDYQYEIGLSYFDGDVESTDFDGYILEGTAHFGKVDTSHGPLAEASFLDKSSYVTLTLDSTEYDVSGSDKVKENSLFGRFYANDTVIFEATVTKLKIDSDEETILKGGVGFYANETTDVVISYENYTDVDFSTLSIDSHGVYSVFDNMSIAYDAGIGFIDTNEDKGTVVNGAVKFYPMTSLGFGLSLERTSVEEFSATEVGLFVDYFVIDNLELNLAYTTENQDFDGGFDLDIDELTVGVAFRF